MPYRIDVRNPPDNSLDRLVALGALDVEPVAGGVAALMPDGITAATVARILGVDTVAVSPAIARDEGSTWVLSPRHVRAGGLVLVPADMPAPPGALKLCDGPAFGTGLHATTALCLDALAETLDLGVPPRVLDVGTGSGVLALAALVKGVPQAVGLDIDPRALHVAAQNARINKLAGRLQLVRGGPEALDGSWPLVLANVLAAPLMAMAGTLVRRVGSGGRLVLSGIPSSVAPEVDRAYRRLGMQQVRAETRAGWAALVLHPSW